MLKMSASLASKYMEQLTRGPFTKDFVEQVINAQDTILDDICQTLRLTHHQSIRSETLNQEHVTREQLCEWLEAASCLLHTCSVPLLQNALPLASAVEELRVEKIANQKTIMKLQQVIIDKKEAELKAMEPTVVYSRSSGPVPQARQIRQDPLSRKKFVQELSKVRNNPTSSVREAQLELQGAGKAELRAMEPTVVHSRSFGVPPAREIPLDPHNLRKLATILSKEELENGIDDKMSEVLSQMEDIKFNSSDHVTKVLKRAKSIRDEEN